VGRKKEDYEKCFNELLGTNIRWSLLRYEDLLQLAVLLDNPDVLAKRLGLEKEAGRQRLIEAGIETVREVAGQWQGPVARLFRKIVEEEEK